MRRLDPLLLAPAAVSIACLWIVPTFPLTHLEDPGHWGVLGYVVVLALLARIRARPSRPASHRQEQRLFTWFLAGMPVIYLAYWLAQMGDFGELWLQLAAAAGFWLLAWHGRSSYRALAFGIAAHGLWDGSYVLRGDPASDFVADWYALACCIVDLGMAVYVWRRGRLWIA